MFRLLRHCQFEPFSVTMTKDSADYCQTCIDWWKSQIINWTYDKRWLQFGRLFVFTTGDFESIHFLFLLILIRCSSYQLLTFSFLLSTQFSLTFLEVEMLQNAYLWIFLEVMLLCSNPATNQMILNTMSQGEVIIAWSRNISVFNQSEMEVTIETFLHFPDVLNLSDSAHRNLFTLVNVSNGTTHVWLLLRNGTRNSKKFSQFN